MEDQYQAKFFSITSKILKDIGKEIDEHDTKTQDSQTHERDLYIMNLELLGKYVAWLEENYSNPDLDPIKNLIDVEFDEDDDDAFTTMIQEALNYGMSIYERRGIDSNDEDNSVESINNEESIDSEGINPEGDLISLGVDLIDYISGTEDTSEIDADSEDSESDEGHCIYVRDEYYDGERTNPNEEDLPLNRGYLENYFDACVSFADHKPPDLSIIKKEYGDKGEQDTNKATPPDTNKATPPDTNKATPPDTNKATPPDTKDPTLTDE